jgi:hypothetical protein
MIKWVFVFFISLIAPVVQAPVLAQAVMTNPEIPRAKDAGRAVVLKEIWRITDASGEFYFKRPVELKAADDGSLFVADEFELLKFSPEGKFLGNLLKKGEGPGETTEGYVTFTLSRNILYVFSYPDKVFCLNFDGELITDAKLPFQRNGALIGIFGNRIYLNETKQPDLKTMIESKLYDYRNVISALDPKTMIESSIMEFPQRFWYGRTGSSSAVYMIWDPCYFAMDEKGGKLAVVNSCDYLIHLADLTTGMLVKSCRYPRLKPWHYHNSSFA